MVEPVGMQIRSEFAANSFGVRDCCEFAVKFTGLRIRSANSLKVASVPPLPHWQFLDFCSADFSEFFESRKLRLCRMLIHYNN